MAVVDGVNASWASVNANRATMDRIVDKVSDLQWGAGPIPAPVQRLRCVRVLQTQFKINSFWINRIIIEVCTYNFFP